MRAAYLILEFAITSMIASIMLLGVCSLIILMLRAMDLSRDISVAQNRADMIFAILRQPLEHCGYGLPKKMADWNSAFDLSHIKPFNWQSPISITTAFVGEYRENAKCRIAYAVPSKIRVLAESVTSDDIIEVQLNGKPHLLEAVTNHKYATSVKNWALFGAMLPNCRPLWMFKSQDTLNGSTLSFKWLKPVSSDAGIFIPENDELFYLRAMECAVIKHNDSYSFFTFDHLGTGWQPRVEGVIDVRFELDPSGYLLKVMTLTRGNIRHSKIISPRTPDGWPEKYTNSIPDDARHYTLLARSASFELKNF
jgi:hypothetical protein